MNYTKLWVGLAVLVALIALGVSVFKSPEVTVGPVGASPGPDRYNPCESANGVGRCFEKKTLATATTTVCAIRSPQHATSTLVQATVLFTTGTTTASTIQMAKANTAFATTTSLGAHTMAANATDQFLASTTPTVGKNPSVVFSPGQWFVVGMTGGVGTFSPVGSCQATFETSI